MPQTPEEESLGSLVARASDQISTLVRSEIALAKAEFRFDLKRVGWAGVMFAAAAFIAHLCLILLSFAFAFLLAELIPTWVAFLIVTGVYLVFAVLAVLIGARRLKGLAGMRRTTKSIKELREIATPDEQPGAGLVGLHREPVSRDGA